MIGSASIYVQAVQTPWLEAAVTAGSFYTVPYGFEVNRLSVMQFSILLLISSLIN